MSGSRLRCQTRSGTYECSGSQNCQPHCRKNSAFHTINTRTIRKLISASRAVKRKSQCRRRGDETQVCSSRREEAPYSSLSSGTKTRLEPPHVGCYLCSLTRNQVRARDETQCPTASRPDEWSIICRPVGRVPLPGVRTCKPKPDTLPGSLLAVVSAFPSLVRFIALVQIEACNRDLSRNKSVCPSAPFLTGR